MLQHTWWTNIGNPDYKTLSGLEERHMEQNVLSTFKFYNIIVKVFKNIGKIEIFIESSVS